MIRCEELEEMVTQAGFLFVDDRIAGAIDQHLRRYHSCEWDDPGIEFERVGHRERIRVAWNRDEVFRAENAGLFKDAATNLSERETVLG